LGGARFRDDLADVSLADLASYYYLILLGYWVEQFTSYCVEQFTSPLRHQLAAVLIEHWGLIPACAAGEGVVTMDVFTSAFATAT
jgi:hypothetical protein